MSQILIDVWACIGILCVIGFASAIIFGLAALPFAGTDQASTFGAWCGRAMMMIISICALFYRIINPS